VAKPTVAIVGASGNRSKYGNISLRAHLSRGFEVFPVNPNERVIEGLRAYRSVLDLPVRPDRVSLYVQPEIGVTLLEDIAAKGCDQLWVNPGAESDELIEKAESLGLNVIQACSIVAIGRSPSEY